MKYLELNVLERTNQVLSRIESNDQTVIVGRVEAYSCKSAGEDKKLYKRLNRHSLSSSPDSHSTLPLSASSMAETQHQHSVSHAHRVGSGGTSKNKILYYLIGTLNAAFPDYDFSDLNMGHFKVLASSLSTVINMINTWLFNIGLDKSTISYKDFTKTLWDSIDSVIQLNECEIFSYIPDMDSDPFGEEGCIWSFNYFFWNKKLKRIVFFYCRSLTLMDSIEDFIDNQSSNSSSRVFRKEPDQDMSRSASPLQL